MNNKLLMMASAAALLMTGCVTSEYMTVGGTMYPPRPETHEIDVYLPGDAPVAMHNAVLHARSASDVPDSASVIGRIDSTGAPAAEWSHVFSDAMEKARLLGGDGILVESWDRSLDWVDSNGGVHHAKELSMKVVRYER